MQRATKRDSVFFVVVVVVVFYARNSVFPELAFKDIIGLNGCIANFKPLITLV